VLNSLGLSTRHLNDNVHWGHWFYCPHAVHILERIGFRVVRLIAIQNPINPRLKENGVDAEGSCSAQVNLKTPPRSPQDWRSGRWLRTSSI
jgi:hypothetical protein